VPPVRLLERGDSKRPGEKRRAGGADGRRCLPRRTSFESDAPEDQRRAALAKWITDPKNPLAARVIVNRVWQYHFGTGIVATPNDMGFNGDRPSHPELLDRLAARLRRGWMEA